MEGLPKAGELIPDILAILARMPSGSAALTSAVAAQHGFGTLPPEGVDPAADAFRLKFDAAVGFLVRSGFVGKERPRKPLHVTKSGRHLLSRLPGLDLGSVSEAIEPRGIPSGRSLSGKDTDSLARTQEIQEASERMAARLTERLAGMQIDRIYALWMNSERCLQDSRPEMRLAAGLVLKAVAAERERRAALGIPASKPAFRWPSTEADRGRNGLAMAAAADLGILARMGYRVGQTRGLPTQVRRRILERTFEGPLPPAPEAYATLWDEPSSPGRLRKIASTIAALARNGRRRGCDAMEEAVAEWEDDLAWLKERFYEGRFDGGFRWPSLLEPEPSPMPGP